MRDERVGLSPTLFFALSILLIACATQRAASLEVTIAQISPIAMRHVSPQGGVPVDYRLEVTNPLDHEVTLKLIELETVGFSGGYSMKRVRHPFDRKIPPRGSASVDFRAWVQPLEQSDSGQISGRVMLRGTARFESLGKTIQSAFAGRGDAVSP